ncbi:processed acidic surface protein [Bacillus sp. CBEL-1]|uniref:processed acidic surface protein n=1 Tax=Bacillus sp. CBEL-1 TaxID=2502980 RepID=UPI00104B2243|nr:processed acidic surface protein [Bacillus sp. CBEL-1]TDB50028.1 processed acidic surface protein [Bacillus sp. CBEL-1]
MKKGVSILLALLLMVSSFPGVSFAAQSKTFEADLKNYLTTVSTTRGFDVSKEDIEFSLSLYDEELSNFDTVEELKEFLGEVIKSDLSNLSFIYESYDLNQKSLQSLLEENGEDLNDYVFVDDLDQTVFFYLEDEFDYADDEEYTDEISTDDFESALQMLEDEFGLTREELERINDHLMSIEDELANEETLNRLMALAERLAAFEDFDTTTELTSDQIAELMSIYNEMLSIFKMKATYTLIQDGTEKPLSLFDLMNMKELKNASLKINLYTADGKFLADMIITGEMVDSDTVANTGKSIEKSAQNVNNVVKQAPVKEKTQKTEVKKAEVKKTVKGARLPNTASNYLLNTLIGASIVLLAFVSYRKVRRA